MSCGHSQYPTSAPHFAMACAANRKLRTPRPPACMPDASLNAQPVAQFSINTPRPTSSSHLMVQGEKLILINAPGTQGFMLARTR